MALTVSVLLLLGVVLFVVRFVRSVFGQKSEEQPDSNCSDPFSGVPVRRKGGPPGRVAAAEAEEPDEYDEF